MAADPKGPRLFYVPGTVAPCIRAPGGSLRRFLATNPSGAQTLAGFRSVEVLNIVSTMPARYSVARADHDSPLNRLTTKIGKITGPAEAAAPAGFAPCRRTLIAFASQSAPFVGLGSR